MTREETRKLLHNSKPKGSNAHSLMLNEALDIAIEALEQEPIGYCKDCKHWKESDGTYRRDINAESKCPMNRVEVYEGTGYCFLFESN